MMLVFCDLVKTWKWSELAQSHIIALEKFSQKNDKQRMMTPAQNKD